jgi:hypothetical protein
MSKAAQSGLRTVKRDFSDSSSFPASSQEIYWPPTQHPAPPKLTGVQQRLKAIQDALAETSASHEPLNALVESRTVNKRSSPGPDTALPAKKSRQLPPSWQEKDSLSAPSLSSKSSFNLKKGSARAVTSSATSTPLVSSSSKAKIPAVFLSQEQTQILRLVKDGRSLFYTGSAGQLYTHIVHFYRDPTRLIIFLGTGKSVLLREIIKTLRKKYVTAPDAVAITASTGL